MMATMETDRGWEVRRVVNRGGLARAMGLWRGHARGSVREQGGRKGLVMAGGSPEKNCKHSVGGWPKASWTRSIAGSEGVGKKAEGEPCQ